MTEHVLAQVLSEVFEYSPLPFCITTAEENSRYVRVNSAFLRMIGRNWEEIADREIVEDMTVVASDPDRSRRQARLRTHGYYEMEEVDLRHSSGRTVHTIINAYRRSIDGIELDIEIIQDNTDRKAYELSILRTAMTDGMTGLSNRTAFEEALFDLASKENGSGRFHLVFIDLNKFKDVNDRLGHAAGDRLLQIIAERLRAEVGADDVVARLGGDEFGLLIVWENDGYAIDSFLRTMAERVCNGLQIDGVQISIGMAIGSSYAGMPADGRTMLLHADQLMYQAKATGESIEVRSASVADYLANENETTMMTLRPGEARTDTAGA